MYILLPLAGFPSTMWELLFPIVRKYLYLSQQCHYICPNKKVNIFYLVQCCVLIYRYRNIPYHDITYLHAVQDTRLSVNRYTTMYL